MVGNTEFLCIFPEGTWINFGDQATDKTDLSVLKINFLNE